MRMRSCKLPVWLTVFAFLQPAFYVMFRVNKLEIFNWGELGEYVLDAVLVTIVIWLFYGIFCLVATRSQSASTGISWLRDHVYSILCITCAVFAFIVCLCSFWLMVAPRKGYMAEVFAHAFGSIGLVIALVFALTSIGFRIIWIRRKKK
jgi:hypothetical protein